MLTSVWLIIADVCHVSLLLLQFTELGLDGLDEVGALDLDLLAGLDDPELDDAVGELGLADDEGEGDPVLLAILQLGQHLWVLLVGLLSLKNKRQVSSRSVFF